MIFSSPGQLKYIPQRIISLVPSQTELLSHLGLDKETIGITKFCIHPAQWRDEKTKIGGTKNINLSLVNALQPDLIIANKEENVKEQIDELAELYDIWVTDVKNLHDALQMITDIGLLTHRQKEATDLMDKIIQQFETLTIKHQPINTAYLIWKDPYMTIGGDTFINDMLKRVGLKNIFTDKIRYPQIDIEQLKEKKCQLLLLSSEPYPFKQKHVDELVQSLPNCHIHLVDGEYFSWYGSRLLKAPSYFNQLLKSII